MAALSGLWEWSLSRRRELSHGPAAAESTSLLWVSTGVGQVSLQCPRLPVVAGITGMSFPSATVLNTQPEAQPPSPASDLALMLG